MNNYLITIRIQAINDDAAEVVRSEMSAAVHDFHDSEGGFEFYETTVKQEMI